MAKGEDTRHHPARRVERGTWAMAAQADIEAQRAKASSPNASNQDYHAYMAANEGYERKRSGLFDTSGSWETRESGSVVNSDAER